MMIEARLCHDLPLEQRRKLLLWYTADHDAIVPRFLSALQFPGILEPKSSVRLFKSLNFFESFEFF